MDNAPEIIRQCFDSDRALYSGHARREMQEEEFGPISDQEVYEAICNGEVIETYPNDTPYPSVLIFGMTANNRPLHTVCAYDREDDRVVIVTIYQPINLIPVGGKIIEGGKDKMLKCIICQGEDIQTTEVKEELKVKNDIVYVPIQILVCRACGERYYDRRTIRFLEEVEKKLREGKANLQEVGKVLVYS